MMLLKGSGKNSHLDILVTKQAKSFQALSTSMKYNADWNGYAFDASPSCLTGTKSSDTNLRYSQDFYGKKFTTANMKP